MIRWLLDLLFPPRCVLCHKFLKNSATPVCDRCGKFVLSQNIHSKYGKHFTRCIAPLPYEGAVRESIHRFKFCGLRFYAGTYGGWMASAIGQELDGFDVLTWVPISRKRRRKRGFDQSEELCTKIAGLLEISAVCTLQKIRDNPAQSGLSDAFRRKANVAGAYVPAAPEQVAGKRVLLIDDVITTGSTLDECSRVLKKAGAKEVVCAAVAATK